MELVPTIRLASVVEVDNPPQPDPTEDYQEASRIYPGITDPQVVGGIRLEGSLEMRITASRSVKRYPQRPFVPLPPADLGSTTLADAVAALEPAHALALEREEDRQPRKRIHAWTCLKRDSRCAHGSSSGQRPS